MTLQAPANRRWPSSERPAQRLLAQGAQALSDAELLALLMGTALAGASALELARRALSELGGLAGVLNASRSQFEAVAGLGALRHARAQAALEIAKRLLRQDLARGPVLSAPGRVRDFLRLSFGRIVGLEEARARAVARARRTACGEARRKAWAAGRRRAWRCPGIQRAVRRRSRIDILSTQARFARYAWRFPERQARPL